MELLLTGQHFLLFQGVVALTPQTLYLLLDITPSFFEATLRTHFQFPKETFLLNRILTAVSLRNCSMENAHEEAAKQVWHFGRVCWQVASESGGHSTDTHPIGKRRASLKARCGSLLVVIYSVISGGGEPLSDQLACVFRDGWFRISLCKNGKWAFQRSEN